MDNDFETEEGPHDLTPESDGVQFDGLVVIGKIVAVREVRRKIDNSVVPGMSNIDIAGSRGVETVQAQTVLRTMMGTFDKSAEFNFLVNGLNKDVVVAVGKVTAGAFTNYIALFVKEF